MANLAAQLQKSIKESFKERNKNKTVAVSLSAKDYALRQLRLSTSTTTASRAKRSRVAVTSLLLLILLAVAAKIVLNQRSKFNTQADSYNQQTQILDTKISEATIVQSHLKQSRAIARAISVALPPTMKLPDLINVLTAAALRTGVQWTQGTDSSSSSGAVGQLTPSSFTISVSGPLTNIIQFINVMQKLPRIITVTSVSTNPSGSGNGIQAAIEARTYMWSPSQATSTP